MKTQRFVYGLWVAVMVVGLLPAVASADGAGAKLSRGAVNTLTGWAELPKQVIDRSSSDNPYLGMTYGLADGLSNGLHRTLYGAWDSITFLVPPHEKPALQPETLIAE